MRQGEDLDWERSETWRGVSQRKELDRERSYSEKGVRQGEE